jgi:hypothetical protein
MSPLKIGLAGKRDGGASDSDPTTLRAAASMPGAALAHGEQPAVVAHSSAAACIGEMYQRTTW